MEIGLSFTSRACVPKSCFQPAVPPFCGTAHFVCSQIWRDTSLFTTAAASTGGTGSPHSGLSAQTPNEDLSSIRQLWRSTPQLPAKVLRWLERLLPHLT